MRAERIIEGERRGIGRGNVNEWPPKASTALDLLLDDLHEAREQRTRIDTLIRAFTAQDATTGLNNRLFSIISWRRCWKIRKTSARMAW